MSMAIWFGGIAFIHWAGASAGGCRYLIDVDVMKWSGSMRAFLRNSSIIMIIIIAVLLSGDPAYCQATPRATEPTPTPAPKLPLMIGDKLKISFYETIDVGAAKRGGPESAAPQPALRTFYQRMDVSGDYTIEQDGAISVPLLGRFQLEGRALDDVRDELALSFTNATGRTANTDVRILDRSPVYVVGSVKSPGAYKYVPGMIVLHAIALAGGLDRGESNLSGMIEGARQMERLRSVTVEVQQLLARRARLLAERDGETVLPMPVQLTTIAGEAAARNFLATEGTILRAEQFKHQQEQKEIGLKILATQSEVEALRRKLDQADVQKDLRTERLDDIQKLKDRGLVTSNNVLMLRSELSDVEARRQDYMVAFVQAKARLAEAEGAGARLASERAASLAAAIASADRELAVAREAIISASYLASILYRPASIGQEADSYQIVRQSRDGATTRAATETSPLMPGDVLKINLKSSASKPVSAAPVPTPEPPRLPDVQTSDKSLISWPAEGLGGSRQPAAGLLPVSSGDQGLCAGCGLWFDHFQAWHHRHRKAAASTALPTRR
ncbi:MAG TPA: polysaccharide biosynthesis/export family protein [Bradyrhizobium sp.]|nr:polysaccharide biosynthesis/export family protein [Bradyrhizobium sp.]